MICLDTNVIIRMVTGDDPVQSPVAEEVFGSLTVERPGFVTFVSILELNWVLSRGYGLSKPEVLDVLEQLLGTEQLEFDDGESVWTAVLAARQGADLEDALLVGTAHLYGCEETVTFDQSAADRLGMRLLS